MTRLAREKRGEDLFVQAAVFKAAYQGLKDQGILVRYFDRPGLTDKIRITVGTADENNALLAGIKSLEPAAVA